MRALAALVLCLISSVPCAAGVVRLSAMPDTVRQGRTLSVEALFNLPPDMIGGEFLGKKVPFFHVDSLAYRALLGIPVTLEPGPHVMIIRAEGGEEGGRQASA